MPQHVRAVHEHNIQAYRFRVYYHSDVIMCIHCCCVLGFLSNAAVIDAVAVVVIAARRVEERSRGNFMAQAAAGQRGNR
jgi:hypothetical protein